MSIRYLAEYLPHPSVAPHIDSVAPNHALIGTTVTVNGTSFGAAGGTVTFNGVTATVNSWSAIAIECIVPAGATTGDVVVHRNDAVDSNTYAFTVDKRNRSMVAVL
jgi:hypothetical protein